MWVNWHFSRSCGSDRSLSRYEPQKNWVKKNIIEFGGKIKRARDRLTLIDRPIRSHSSPSWSHHHTRTMDSAFAPNHRHLAWAASSVDFIQSHPACAQQAPQAPAGASCVVLLVRASPRRRSGRLAGTTRPSDSRYTRPGRSRLSAANVWTTVIQCVRLCPFRRPQRGVVVAPRRAPSPKP